MAETTEIEWANSTWNPAYGCTKVSEGCALCYMFRWAKRTGRDPTKVMRAAEATFNLPLRWSKEDMKPGPDRYNPKEWGRKVFTLSLGDFFHEDCDPFRDEMWEIIRRCRNLTFLILTKRPERIAEHLPRTCFECGKELDNAAEHYVSEMGEDGHLFHGWTYDGKYGAPWPNVWLGTSVENQRRAEERIPKLVAVPAVVHFLSCEPLLGSIDFSLSDWFAKGAPGREAKVPSPLLDDIEWVIVGGESDYEHPRPSDPNWFRSIRDQCAQIGVPFFFKQSGGTKKCAHCGSWGCNLLDGRVYNAFPGRRLGGVR